jgi:thiamine-monophosphate kinase
LPREFELVARYFAPLARDFPGAYGLLDDVAVIRPALHHELVVKTDAIVSGVDFPADTPADCVARKALRVNLSDLAAKGAVPRAYVLDLMLPGSIDESWIAAFAAGLQRDQLEYGIHLIGGDTGSTTGPVVAAVCALGEAPSGRIIRRGGAREGDVIYVTGTVGDAALGLALLNGDLTDMETGSSEFLIERYRTPQPRVALGPHLIGLATASIDVSDGLVADLRHVGACSGLSAVIETASLPLSSAARSAVARDSSRLGAILAGGDDYEILFTAHPDAASRIDELSRATELAITPIGYMTPPAPDGMTDVAVLDPSGCRVRLEREGWTHFGSR